MIIDTEKLDSLTLQEVGLLLLLYDKRTDKSRTVLQVKDIDIYNLLEELEKRKYIMSAVYSTDFSYEPPYRRVCYSLLDNGKQALADNCISDRKTLKTISGKALKERCDALASRLIEIYPIGTKPGTNMKWRGSVNVVSDKLQKLITAGNEFTDEEAIEATRNYISTHNGQYTNMRVLPYFLSKNVLVGGEVRKTCDFMSYVEDLRSNPEQSNLSKDWDVTLC